MLELLQRCYDAGDIELDTYSGKYCVSCEEYYTDDELLEGGLCPIHRTPVEYYEEENYFFRLSRFQDRLLDWYALHPDAIKPEHRSREALGLIRGGLRDFSVSRTSVSWGIPLPWDPAHVTYVWFDALTNYLSAVGFGDPEQDYTDWWPVDYHLIGKDIIRHHCVYWPAMLMSAGVEPPKGYAVGGWLLVGGEKMAKSGGNAVNPLELIDLVGVDGFRYYVLAETPYGSDGDFTVEGLVARYNGDLANNLGNLVSRVATVVAKKCDGDRPRAARRQPARRSGCDCVRRCGGGVGRRRSVTRARRHLVADPRHERLPRGQRAVEVRTRCGGRRGDGRRARGVADRRRARLPGRAAHQPGDLGADRPQGQHRRPAPARGRRVGRLPGRRRGRQGRLAVPAHQLIAMQPTGLVRLALPRARRPHPGRHGGRRRRGCRGGRVGDDHGRVRSRDVAGGDRRRRRATPTCGPPSGSTRTTPSTASTRSSTCSTRDRVVAVGEAGLDYYYDHSPRDVQRAAFAAQIQLAHERRLPLVIHTRDAWDDTFDVLAAEGVPERTIFHCFTGGPDEARRCLDIGAFVSFSGIVTFKNATPIQEAARVVPLDRILVETDAPYLAPVPHRGQPNQPAWVPFVGSIRRRAARDRARRPGRRDRCQHRAACVPRGGFIAPSS